MNNNINNSSYSPPMLLVSVTSPSRGSSPTRGDLRGIHLFRAISRKISRGHRSRHCDNHSAYESYSSTDSEHSSGSETSGSGSGHNSPDSMRSESSASAIRRVFQSLSIGNANERRNSDGNCHKKSSSNSTPKRILRQPVTYDYKRGISGLPTIRVPRNSNCCTHLSPAR
ncbi:uncharacterized protein LOC111048130 [Nilaparvata lugens]|uniref:uncharacterized protein LOC111048130 n=1 Tax=Nilaparvata lugens TaxID=108931 RepID=UPI000B992045|nr:uncharacterized protein LOC111048130 [Nilaparvata lugens]